MVGEGRERFLAVGFRVGDDGAFREFFLIEEGVGFGGLLAAVVVVVVVVVVDDGLESEVWAPPRPGKGSCFHFVGVRVTSFAGGGGDGGGGRSGLSFSEESLRVGRGGAEASSMIAALSHVYLQMIPSLRSTPDYVQRMGFTK